MGIVYLARELRLARPVAIKVLPRALAAAKPDLRELFVREAQMAARLSHPNIVPIHHVDEAGEFVFFVMTYIEGETLGERLRARGPLSPAEGARVLREIGWALAYAHVRGIVHRDVKPDNILLERGSNRALVSDFGIAGAVSTGDSMNANDVRGTAHFLSPEQAMGEASDGRSDIYSLGVVGYYALTGQLPFDGATTVQVMAAHLAGRPKSLREFAPHVPRKLAGAVERCMEKDRDRRWPTGEAFAEAVDAAFEQPREIPAPLRLWLSKGRSSSAFRVLLTLFLLAGPFAVLVLAHPWTLLLALPLAIAIGSAPEVILARRLLRQGFTLADMRDALRTHVIQRREEIELDPAFTPISQRTLRVTAAAGLATAAVSAMLLTSHAISAAVPAALTGMIAALGGAVGIGCAVGSLFSKPRSSYIKNFGKSRLDFWNGKSGERIVRLAGLGLKRSAISPTSLPQHTEIALGRATDALFGALPKKLRRELKAVPKTVQRLEADASSLRESLDKLDELLSGTDDPELRRRREKASEQLASTVTALENIRLGLLRLQLGSAPVAQVTEALKAASRIGREIDIALDAEDEIGDVLKPKRVSNRDPEPSPV
jgi:hypothetical protein